MRKLFFSILFTFAFVELSHAENEFGSDTTIKGVTSESLPVDFSGISLDTALLKPNAERIRLFDNKSLINLFKTIGIKNLSMGGPSCDDPGLTITNADIDSLFAFAHAADIKVRFPFRLKGATPDSISASVTQAKYIMDHYAENLDCFTLGYEPDQYLTPYDTLLKAWTSFETAILAQCPAAHFSGPGTTNKDTAVRFSHDFVNHPEIRDISYHDYPNQNGSLSPDEIKKKLMPSFAEPSQEYTRLTDPIAKDHHSLRIDETGAFRFPIAGATDSFAGGFWAFGQEETWAAYHVIGVNLTNSVFCITEEGKVKALPTAYFLLMRKLGSQGKFIETEDTVEVGFSGVVFGPVSGGDLTFGNDGAYYATMLDGEHGAPEHRDGSFRYHFPKKISIHQLDICILSVPHRDVSAQSGLTLGGAEITPDGTWNGVWTPLPKPADEHEIGYVIPAGSAAVLRMR